MHAHRKFNDDYDADDDDDDHDHDDDNSYNHGEYDAIGEMRLCAGDRRVPVIRAGALN